MNQRPRDADVRAAQERILLDLAARLGRGDPPLPTDLMAPLLEELTQRIDEDAVAEAWELQGDEEATPWDLVRGRLLR
ncbi:MAG TPA: hypothetical protein VLS89_08180 [Candidatus Nanopelagicales bacterium]|nr:hypothetical protein [Candidatus Nanopelagicales bacterium]